MPAEGSVSTRLGPMSKKTYTFEEIADMVMSMTEEQFTERTRLIMKGLAKFEGRRKKDSS